jgi:O-antigen/teichoic acid export membrane protein
MSKVRLSFSGVLSSGLLLFASTTIVNLGNYLFNLLMGRWLGPAAFADLSLMVTLMLVITLVTATVQTVVAKLGASYAAQGADDALVGLRCWGVRWSWGLGVGLAVVLVVGAASLQRFFNTASPWPFVLLGIGIPLYFAQGVDRGVLQGRMHFGTLAMSYQAEMWVRLGVGVALVGLGLAVNGAVAALTLSFVATWLVARQVKKRLPASGRFSAEDRQAALAFALPVTVALFGQILINNSDVLIVKRFFEAESAGHYAALALIGRIVFFATWSVVTVLLPTVAQRHQRGEPHAHLLWMAIGAVVLVSALVIALSWMIPTQIVTILFGADYLAIAPLLWLYATATALYALVNVLITYQLSVGDGSGSYFALAGGIAQVIVLWLHHSSLGQVVLLQIGLMTLLLTALVGWALIQHGAHRIASWQKMNHPIKVHEFDRYTHYAPRTTSSRSG